MSYIITAKFPTEDDVNRSDGLDTILSNPKIRHLHTDKINCYETVDLRGEFDKRAELTMYLCKCLIDSGIYRFEIEHSF